MMYYKNKRLGLENYSELFSSYSLDIQDEVRSMILDGLDLTEWVEPCKDDPFRLMQIRLASKEGVSPSLFGLSGRVLYLVRSLIREGYSLSPVLPYIKSGFSDEQWFMLLDWLKQGWVTEDLNLLRVPAGMWVSLDKGFRQGLPMAIFATGKFKSATIIASLIKVMSQGYSIEKYLVDEWDTGVIVKLGNSARSRWFSTLHELIQPYTTIEFLDNIIELARAGVKFEKYLVVSSSKNPKDSSYLYQSYHLDWLFQASKRRLPLERLEDPNLRNSECSEIFHELLSEDLKNFSGRL